MSHIKGRGGEGGGGERTYINKMETPSLNASGSIISIGLSDNILERQKQDR